MRNHMIARIAALPEMSPPELKKLWKKLYSCEPPAFNKNNFVRRLAYRIQELEYGIDSRALESQLETHARQHLDLQGKVKQKLRKNSPERPVAGTRLMREYQGEEHHVTVLHYGFEYRGQRYKSLSRIARIITGQQWSGPLFFGLRRAGGGKP